jgi:hypothetical protein
MLGCTSVTLNSREAAGVCRSRWKPNTKSATIVTNGRMISPIQAERRLGRPNTAAAAHRSETEVHTTKNDTPQTPVSEANWIRGRSRCCDTPSRFHGNPPSSRVSSISNATQLAPHESAQSIRPLQPRAIRRSAAASHACAPSSGFEI